MSLNKNFLPFFLFIVTIFNVNAQIVKFIKNPLTAKYRVFITNQPSQATLFVYKTKKYMLFDIEVVKNKVEEFGLN
jgi:hypothetical protein